MTYTRDTSTRTNYVVDWTLQGSYSKYVQLIPLIQKRTGEEKLQYREMIKLRQNATTSLDCTYDSFVHAPGTSEITMIKNVQGPWIGSDTVPRPGQIPSFDFSSMEKDAVAQAIKYFNSHIVQLQRPFASQVFLGELKEAILYLRNPFAASLKLASVLDKKIVKARSKKSIREIANIYLEFRFGVIPLMSDIKDILLLVKQEILEAEVKKMKGYGEAMSSTVTTVDYGVTSVAGFLSQKTVKNMSQCFIKAGLVIAKLDLAASAVDRAMDAITSFQALPGTLWELTPYSFLIDYFTNVGDIIETPLSAYGALSYYSRSVVNTTEVIVQQLATKVYAPALFKSATIIKPSSWHHTRRRIVRTGVASAIPPLRFNLPGSNVQYGNIAALLAKYL